ncbi:MAG: hypothetical protein WCB85_01570, partial [Candidatus Dormiibacterota bacterium]
MSISEKGTRGEGVGIADVEAAVERWRVQGYAACPPEQLRDGLRRVRHLVDIPELQFAGMVTQLAACDEEEWEGHTSPTNWVREECRTSGHAAWNALVVGEQSARLPESTQALLGDQISYPQLSL